MALLAHFGSLFGSLLIEEFHRKMGPKKGPKMGHFRGTSFWVILDPQTLPGAQNDPPNGPFTEADY